MGLTNFINFVVQMTLPNHLFIQKTSDIYKIVGSI